MYIADQNNNRIRKVVAATSVISTVAGSSTSAAYSGDGGDATSAELNIPVDVAVDSSGKHSSLYFVLISRVILYLLLFR